MRIKNKTYSVNLWGSTPRTNDDCNTGEDFANIDDATEVYNHPETLFRGVDVSSSAWLELIGPGVNMTRKNAKFVAREDGGSDWENEHAVQMGMFFGCAGYNDARGCGVHAPEGEEI